MTPKVIILAPKGRLLFYQPRKILVAQHVSDVIPVLEEVQCAVQSEGLWAAGMVAYEAAPSFDAALETHPHQGPVPLAWFGLFDPPESIPVASTFSFTESKLVWKPDITQDEYNTAIAQIREAIRCGETYQVNFTMRLRTSFTGSADMLFERLVAAQCPEYGAFVDTDTFAVCSASPELFFRLEDGIITSKPMKGTISRGLTFEQDRQQAKALSESIKDRAENVMIVDMIRNDLGRIARTGSVHVERLFEVEQYPTVWQMTSTVQAETIADLPTIMSAMFPCASITGAPKPRTMHIITEHEKSPRKIYCGTIGYLAPHRYARFNVAIRTVLIDKEHNQAEYGVGGGIVWDSKPDLEFEECHIKARVLFTCPESFQILESIRWSAEEGFVLLDAHIERMRQSAMYFNYPCDTAALLDALFLETAKTSPDAWKVRLLLDKEGSVSCESVPLPDQTNIGLLRLRFASCPVHSTDPFLYHKTTRRRVYEEALAERGDADDVILWNERGEVTEATSSNIVVKIGGQLVTPAISSGLLPGTYRDMLLRKKEIVEKVLSITQLSEAESIFLINSVRGMRPAMLSDEHSL